MEKTTKNSVPNDTKKYIGKDISIVLGGATAPSAVVVRFLHTYCINETEKAIQLKLNDNSTLWLPKKGLLVVKSEYATDTIYRIAKWVKFSESQERMIERNHSISGVSCV